MQVIRTKWHQMVPLIEQDEVYVPALAEPDGTITKRARHWSVFMAGQNKRVVEGMLEFIRHASSLPHFAIATDLLSLAAEHDQRLSLLDMKKCGVMRLPYPAMVVEYEREGSPTHRHIIVVLRDMGQHSQQLPWENPEVAAFGRDHETPPDFYGLSFSIERDDDGPYLVISPGIIYIAVQDRTVDGKREPWVKLSSFGSGFFPHNQALADYIGQSYTRDASSVFTAASAILLLMNTAGVDKEVIETTRLNKKRDGVSKPHIPRHTYIHIGRVYRSERDPTGVVYDARRSPRPHYRRGHVRGVHHGEGRVLLKQVFIPGRLVAYKPSVGPEPAAPHYRVVK